MQQEYEMKSSATPLLNNLQSFLLLCCITFIDLRCCVWNISSTIGCATGTNQPLWSGYTIGPRGMSSANITAASILFPPTEMYAQARLFTCLGGIIPPLRRERCRTCSQKRCFSRATENETSIHLWNCCFLMR